MQQSKRKIKSNEVKFFLSDEEELAYRMFLAPFGGKKGPYAKALILEQINRNTKTHSSMILGKNQLDRI